ncbi:Uncharacterised protein [Bordetella pertussis]|nr:Uncharacterised protein [Bordetella pertussis]CFW33510.1 Uncharacterised protein [Bordetella pertussis]
MTLAPTTAVRRSARLRPAEARACGLTCTRTAGRCPPATLTRPTPGICDSRWAMRVSTRSRTCGSGMVGEVTARVSTAASAGLTLL